MNSLSPAQLMRYLRILRADLPRIANGETPATDLLEWPRDVLDFLWRRVGPLHDHQLPPERACDDWTTWLVLGGRGAGKTRAGAEWVMGLASGFGWLTQEPVGRIALVGETFAAARDVMIEGPAGLLKIHEPGERPVWSPALRKLEWRNGAVAHVFSAEDPDSLRAAVRGRLVRRAREMAPCRGDLGHAAVRPAARGASARDRHDDAAADPALAPAAFRRARRGEPGRDRSQRAEPLAGLPRPRRRALRRHAEGAPGARRRDGRGPPGRALDPRRDRAATRRARAAARPHRRRGRPAGLVGARGRRLRHRRGGRRRPPLRVYAIRRTGADQRGAWTGPSLRPPGPNHPPTAGMAARFPNLSVRANCGVPGCRTAGEGQRACRAS